jgi:hypothetical protein
MHIRSNNRLSIWSHKGFEPLAQLVEHLTFNQRVEGSSPSWLTILHGPLVKRLRHRPFTAVTRVRIPYGSYLYFFH